MLMLIIGFIFVFSGCSNIDKNKKVDNNAKIEKEIHVIDTKNINVDNEIEKKRKKKMRLLLLK